MIKHHYMDENMLMLNANKHNVGNPEKKLFTLATCNHYGLSAALATNAFLAPFVPYLPSAC